MKSEHVVFPDWTVTYKSQSSDPTRVAHVKVSIDLDALSKMAIRAAKNKSKVCRDGALTVKLNRLSEVAQ